MSSKEMIAMLLAGGQGRLGVFLMSQTCSSFWGYRIIDFIINCINSGIDTVVC